jgi:hypothetical protein
MHVSTRFEANTSRRPGRAGAQCLINSCFEALLDCSPPLTSDPEAFQRNQLNPDMVLTYEAFIIQKVMATNALPASRGIESVSTPRWAHE